MKKLNAATIRQWKEKAIEQQKRMFEKTYLVELLKQKNELLEEITAYNNNPMITTKDKEYDDDDDDNELTKLRLSSNYISEYRRLRRHLYYVFDILYPEFSGTVQKKDSIIGTFEEMIKGSEYEKQLNAMKSYSLFATTSLLPFPQSSKFKVSMTYPLLNENETNNEFNINMKLKYWLYESSFTESLNIAKEILSKNGEYVNIDEYKIITSNREYLVNFVDKLTEHGLMKIIGLAGSVVICKIKNKSEKFIAEAYFNDDDESQQEYDTIEDKLQKDKLSGISLHDNGEKNLDENNVFSIDVDENLVLDVNQISLDIVQMILVHGIAYTLDYMDKIHMRISNFNHLTMIDQLILYYKNMTVESAMNGNDQYYKEIYKDLDENMGQTGIYHHNVSDIEPKHMNYSRLFYDLIQFKVFTNMKRMINIVAFLTFTIGTFKPNHKLNVTNDSTPVERRIILLRILDLQVYGIKLVNDAIIAKDKNKDKDNNTDKQNKKKTKNNNKKKKLNDDANDDVDDVDLILNEYFNVKDDKKDNNNSNNNNKNKQPNKKNKNKKKK